MSGDGTRQGLTFFQTLGSVLSAMIGIQKQERRERDFKHGNPVHFIVVGLLVTGVFLLTIFGIVQLVLHLAA